MARKTYGVGIIGADAKASWAKASHIPAVQGLAEVHLAAVATRQDESARAAAEAFGADKWFSDPYDMIRDASVDIVTIAVKVPAHRDLVLAALDAGKVVYCEAPLGRTPEEAGLLAEAANGGSAAIGLQARLNPAARRAAEIIAEGRIGDPLFVNVLSTTSGFGAETLKQYLYFEDAASGGNLMTIAGGHTLDLVELLVGDVADVDARAQTVWPHPRILDTVATASRENADHFSVVGKTTSGAVFGAAVLGGTPPEQADFLLEVRGSEGWVRLSGGHPYGFQAGDLTLTSSVGFQAPDRPAVTGGLQNAALNVGEVYASIVRDIENGTRTTPGFDRALHNARLMAAVRSAAESK